MSHEPLFSVRVLTWGEIAPELRQRWLRSSKKTVLGGDFELIAEVKFRNHRTKIINNNYKLFAPQPLEKARESYRELVGMYGEHFVIIPCKDTL